jgi:hypothetical protein
MNHNYTPELCRGQRIEFRAGTPRILAAKLLKGGRVYLAGYRHIEQCGGRPIAAVGPQNGDDMKGLRPIRPIFPSENAIRETDRDRIFSRKAFDQAPLERGFKNRRGIVGWQG